MPTHFQRKSKVLLVDDNELYRDTLEEVFADIFQIQVAADGETALHVVATSHPDLILLDVKMPGIDGHEVCRRLKADPLTRDIPIIFLTSFGEDEDQTHGLALGAVDYIVKPSDFSLIRQRIQTHLELKFHRDQLQQQVSEKVSELAIASQKEREMDLLMEKILMSVPVAIGFVVDRKIVWCNQATTEISGYSCAELEGQSTEMLYPSAEVAKQVATIYPDLVRTGFHSFETLWKTKDGHILDIHVNAVALDKKNPSAGTVFSVTDITAQKQADKLLRASEDKFSKIFKLSPDAVSLTEILTGQYIDVNQSFVALSGWAAEEVIGKSSLELNLWDSIEDRNRMLTELQQHGEALGLEMPFHRKDGQVIIGSLSAKIIQVDGRECIMAIIRDMTERRKIQDEVSRANRLTSLGELAAGMAHEINNPNALILYNSEMLEVIIKDLLPQLEQVPLPRSLTLGGLPYNEAIEEVATLLPSIHDSAQRIKRIVSDLRDFSRGEQQECHEPIDLNRVVEVAVRLAQNTIKKSTDYLFVTLDDTIPPIVGVAGRLEQVVINLLINACQALENPTQKLSVSTSYDPESKQIQLFVNDEGCGMSEDILEHILEPFVTTKREHGGTGLGLSVSARIVSEHRGQLKFTSSPGVGTTAILSLPVTMEGQHVN